LGVGYTVTDKWSIETQAGYARGIGNREKTTPDAENENPHQFFGGVIVNYRF
jgi:hypothetical protein